MSATYVVKDFSANNIKLIHPYFILSILLICEGCREAGAESQLTLGERCSTPIHYRDKQTTDILTDIKA